MVCTQNTPRKSNGCILIYYVLHNYVRRTKCASPVV